MKTYFIFLVSFLASQSTGVFIDTSSVAVRNARWLSENRLNWYHSYVPDVLKLLTQNASNEDDDQRPGFDPGDVPSVKEIHSRLRELCQKSNSFTSMNLTRDCGLDLRFLVCSATNFTNALVGLASGYCQKELKDVHQVQSCLRNVSRQYDANMWTSKLLDSFGKVSAGMFSGNYMHLGSYEQCAQLHVKRPKSLHYQREFNGKFCHATFSVPLSSTRANLATTCYGKNFTQACAPISNTYTVRWGFCLPKSCNIREANGLLFYILYATNLTLCPSRPLVLCVESKPLAVDPLAIAMVVICAALACLVLSATLYDLIDRKILTTQWLGCFGDEHRASTNAAANSVEANEISNHDKNPNQNHGRCVKILLAFSFYTNVKMLLDTRDPKRKETKFLDGIRVLTMAWVILAQVHLLLIYYTGNISALSKMPSVLSFQAINNSSYSTDTFLLLAGFFIGYTFWKNSSDDKGFAKIAKRLIFGLLKRIFRLLPAYIFVIGFALAFWSHFGEGPMWTTAQYGHFGPFFCKFTWWLNLLFVNNFLFLDYPCMPWTWEVAVDVQLHFLALFILILYRKRPLAGFLVSVVLVVLSMVLNGIIVASYGLAPSLLASSDWNRLDSANEYYRKIFIKPYMRWNPYFIGVFLAYIFHRTDKKRDSFGLTYLRNTAVSTAAWASIVLICSALVYGLFNFANGRQISNIAVIIYAVLARTIWSLAVALLILLCARTRSGLVKWFFSWPFWTPLSRLTYCAFLLHGLIIIFFYGTAKEWLYFSFGNMTYFWLSSVIMSYGVGIFLHFGVEMPFRRIAQIFSSAPPQQRATGGESFKLLEDAKEKSQTN